MRNLARYCLFCLPLLLLSVGSFCQQEPNYKDVPQQDLYGLLFGKKKKQKKKPPKASNQLQLAILPVVGANPALGFTFGAAVSGAVYLGDSATTRQSSFLANVNYTTKRQLVFNIRSSLALSGNRFLLESDLRYMIFRQDTYGLGTRIGKAGEQDYAMPEPMDFNYLRLHSVVWTRIKRNLYAGLGLNMDIYNSISDKLLDIPNGVLTSHYRYSRANGFGLRKYSANGLDLGARWDSRDNVANPYKGWYASLSGRFNTQLLGSTTGSFMANLDARYYLNVQPARPRHLVAFWFKAWLSTDNKVPYLALPAIGWDTYNRTGRGFIQGRFRGPDLLYQETEYRFPISKNGLLGGVAFVNFTTASGNGQKVFDQTAIGSGAGLRVKLDKASRANITLDYAFGSSGQRGVFISLQEAF